MGDPVIEFRRVSKRFRIAAAPPVSLGGLARAPWKVVHLVRPARRDVWALQDVSFAVERGETVGLVGANGAGKSTALKLLARVTSPTEGVVRARGRLGALIELGAGFHPELTGRENVYLYGSILGMKRRQIAAKLDEIVEFAGVRPYLDTPLKRYSSGMMVRLGFAVAAHTDPEILLVDEVISVGDYLFREKCAAKIKEFSARGVTMIVVSHNRQLVEELCPRAIVLGGGRVVADDRTARAFEAYHRSSASLDGVGNKVRSHREHGAPLSVTGLVLVGPDGGEQSEFGPGEALRVRISVEARERVKDAFAFCRIRRGLETVHSTESELLDIEPDERRVLEVVYPALALVKGSYTFDIGVRPKSKLALPYDRWNHVLPFSVRGYPGDGFVDLAHEWRVRGAIDATTNGAIG